MTTANGLPHIELFETSDEDERRLVHIVAAMRGHIEDEVEYEVEDDPADPRRVPLPRRHQLFLCAYLDHFLSNAMHTIHPQEATRLDQGRDNPWITAMQTWDGATQDA